MKNLCSFVSIRVASQTKKYLKNNYGKTCVSRDFFVPL